MLVVAYMRYSSENQRDGYSIDAQKRAIDEYCERQGWQIVKYYIDEAKTGTTDNREEFLQMIADAPTGSFEGVVVHKFDRFSRDKYDNAIYKRELRNNGIRVHSVLEQLNDSPESIILETLLEGMAQYYSENLSREVKKGLKEKALGAGWCGGTPPFGYETTSDGQLKIVPHEAEIVKIIYDLYKNGKPILEIANHLNSLGYKTKGTTNTPGVDFCAPSVRGILRNEKYVGTFMYRKTKQVKTKTGSRNIPQKKTDTIVVENGVPAIIDEEIWIACQDRMNSNTYNTTRAKVQYLLIGLMFCGDCKAPYVGGGSVPRYDKGGKEVCRYNFYSCSGKRGGKKCKGCNVSKDRIENAAINGIIEHCYSDKSIEIFVEDFQRWCENNMAENSRDIALYQDELTKLEQQKSRIVSLALNGVLSPIEAKEEKDKIERKISTIEPRLYSLKNKAVPKKKDLVDFMQDTRRRLLDGTYTDYASLIRQHVAKIEVFKDYQLITLKKVPYMTEPNERDKEKDTIKNNSDSVSFPLRVLFSFILTKKAQL